MSMRPKYFRKKEIDLVNELNMVITEYDEIYNKGSRYGTPDCFIIEQKNILCDNYAQTLYMKESKRKCQYCNRLFNKYYVIKHSNKSCKLNPNIKTKKHIPYESSL